jgi:hypothetical protein
MPIPEDDVNTYHIDSYAFYDNSAPEAPPWALGRIDTLVMRGLLSW